MNLLFEAAKEFQDKIKSQNWQFCYIGGLALIRWGEIRMTQDIDLALFTSFGDEEKYIDFLIKNFATRINDAKTFAMQNRILLLKASNSVSADISLAGIPFEEKMIKRASQFEFDKNFKIITCSAEDLIILKAFADRPKDWLDIASILIKQKNKLDLKYIYENLAPLCEIKNKPAILDQLKKINRKLKKND